MEKKQRGELIVGLDVGTTKISAVIGEVLENRVDIIGIGTHPSIGLKKGVVVNIESTVHSIRMAVEEAEEMAGCEIDTVCVGIAGSHIKGFNSPDHGPDGFLVCRIGGQTFCQPGTELNHVNGQVVEQLYGTAVVIKLRQHKTAPMVLQFIDNAACRLEIGFGDDA